MTRPAVHDSLASFRQAVLAIRWGTTAISLALASADIRDGDGGVTIWAGVLLAYTATGRSARCATGTTSRRRALVAAEVAVAVGAVVATGYWDSPSSSRCSPPSPWRGSRAG